MEVTANNIKSASESWHNPGIAGTLRKLIVDNRRQYLVGMGAYLGFWLVFGLIAGLFTSQGGDGESVTYGMISTLFASIVASMSFGDMRKPQDRLAILMQPASAAAKLLPRFLMCTVATAILIIAGYCILEAGRIISFNLIYRQTTPFSWPTVVEYDGSYLIGWLMVANYLIFNQATYFYGGILWPKASYIKTMAICMAFMTLLIVGAASLQYILLSHDYIIVPAVTENTFMWILNSVMLAFTILLVWLAYRRFKTSTILYRLKQI